MKELIGISVKVILISIALNMNFTHNQSFCCSIRTFKKSFYEFTRFHWEQGNCFLTYYFYDIEMNKNYVILFDYDRYD